MTIVATIILTLMAMSIALLLLVAYTRRDVLAARRNVQYDELGLIRPPRFG